jgi:hypothetical protein
VDSITGQPLFSSAAWKSAQNILKVIQAGYLSDPPGIPLYYQVGLDRNKNGLPVWQCIRGTNFTEGVFIILFELVFQILPSYLAMLSTDWLIFNFTTIFMLEQKIELDIDLLVMMIFGFMMNCKQ